MCACFITLLFYREATAINLFAALFGIFGAVAGVTIGYVQELHAFVDALVCGLFIYRALVSYGSMARKIRVSQKQGSSSDLF